MKVSVLIGLKQLTEKQFGTEVWKKALKLSDIDFEPFLFVNSDVDDDIILKIYSNLCKVLKVSSSTLAEYFGNYWIQEYSSKFYPVYFKNKKNVKEFILKINEIHQSVTESIPNAQPPAFEFRWQNADILILTYKSKRNLIDLAVGIIKGAAKYFNDKLIVEKINEKQIKVIFNV